MLKYEEFKTELKRVLEEVCANNRVPVEILLQVTNKVNYLKDGLLIKFKNDVFNKLSIGPEFDIRAIYNNYLANDLEVTVVAEQLLRSALDFSTIYGISSKLEYLTDTNWVLDHTIPCLASKQLNEHLVDDLVTTEYLDLIVLYRVVIDDEEGVLKTMLLKKDILEKLGINVDTLKEYVHSKYTDVSLYAYKKFTDLGLPVDLFTDEMMYVVSNKQMQFGANVLLCPDVFKKLALETEYDLYIIPSSIHECIVCTCREMDVNQLRRIVFQVNHTALELEDILVDNVYYYNKEENTIEIA